MKKILAPRASAILYNILASRPDRRRFLLPANICPIVPLTFLKAGIPFEFVDISTQSLQMDATLVEARLLAAPQEYGGILYAHTYGEPTIPREFFRWVRSRWSDLLLIDDQCLCMPALESEDGGEFDVVLYSTGYAKMADIGIGGYAFVRDEIPYVAHPLPFDEAALRAIEAGYKTSVQARQRYIYRDSAWLQTERALPTWEAYSSHVRRALKQGLEHRAEINAVYNSLLPRDLQLGADFQSWRFNLRLPNKTEVLKRIFDAGLFASSHYASLVGIMGEGSDENARDLADHILNLFNDHHYTAAMAERTAQIILRSL